MGIWDQLNTKTLFGEGQSTATEIDRQTKDIHIQRKNRELLSDTVLINDALFRSDAGPIPGTSIIETTTVTDDTRTVLFTPEAGSVYRLNAVAGLATNPSSADYTMYVTNTPSKGSDALAFYYLSDDSSTVLFTGDANWQTYMFDENVRIEGTVGGSVDAFTWQLNLYRVR